MATYRRILLCYNATREGRCALRLGAALAQQLGAETHLLAVLDDAAWLRGFDVVPAVPFNLEEESAKEVLDEGVKRLAELGVVAIGHLAIGNPMNQIPAFAETLKVDLVVVGHHRSGLLSRWWTGQDDGRLLDRLSCSVLVAMDTGNPEDAWTANDEGVSAGDEVREVAAPRVDEHSVVH
ncbi:universal stress protein [Caballeronia telluris]|uniref:Stress-like protein n=1 Tax=Caballeronia telluris TaxID=326475 RepID=A0A158KAI1_9BURK|nr:universal stress protein [Caballeronia telluris]SAL77550.1 stress-like protein [Caballeronia telluris]